MKYIVESNKRTEIVDSLSFNAAIHDFERDFIDTGESILSVNQLDIIAIGENICERCGVEIVSGVSLTQIPPAPQGYTKSQMEDAIRLLQQVKDGHLNSSAKIDKVIEFLSSLSPAPEQ